ncbi:hypothetical protein CC78DRAFT_582716 [Lojkania enalia]|uniref:Uncharacterized protein n=1 Tax=Lojkania enalia TaxID=147567 RepID=A0A9P4K7H5_9PLEO|nr:hypothetical protein CC78DRAFT_582716 [Didymosphaeria enalia]
MAVWNALIRTHHITSRKKVAKLRQAASNCNVYALLRSGGCPGIMYCEGHESGVREWISTVQRLRYKDFQLVKKAAEIHPDGGPAKTPPSSHSKRNDAEYGKLDEVVSVKDFAARMQESGIWDWWRKGMGYIHES